MTDSKSIRKGDKRKLLWDLCLALALILVSLLALTAIWLFAEEGKYVSVRIDGETVGRYPLSDDLSLPIKSGEDGSFENLLVIEDGKAFVAEANCPDGICAAHAPISKTGESIICLPHKLVIYVESK